MSEKKDKAYPSQFDKVKEITDKLEAGIQALFESEAFKNYLKTLSKFHDYSLNNTILIAMQKPDATLVAGYTAWQKNFGRQVQKGETGIRFLAPTPYKKQMEVDRLDPVTQQPVLNPDGSTVKDLKEIMVPAFRVVNVFDVSQTDGKPLPTIGVDELSGNVANYEMFFEALKRACPVPVGFEDIPSGAKGYYHTVEQRIALQEGMSEVQTVKTMIHEMAHQKLHAIDPKDLPPEEPRLTRNAKEVEAEAVAYTVAQHYHIETSDYSFAYIAGWSKDRDTPELKASLDRIRKAANEMIMAIDDHIFYLENEKNIEVISSAPEEPVPGLQENGVYRYYSTQRPVDIGTFPKPADNKPVEIHNFDKRQSVENGAMQAWGYLEYDEREKRTAFPKKTSVRDQICQQIDEILAKKPKDFPAFLEEMKSAGYEIKTGANMAVKSPGQKRFIRLSSLPDGYKEDDIMAVLFGKVKLQGRTSAGTANQYRSRAGSWLIDVEKKLTEKGPGYAQWAKRHNLKQVSKSFLFLRDQKIRGLSHLSSLVEEKTKARDELLASIKATEVRLAEIATLKKHIINYSKTRSTYEEYRKAGYSKKFFETHREEITLHKAAKQAFDDLGVKKIPKVKDLNEEYARLLSGKKTAYAEYRKLRDEAQELVIAQSNIGSIFEYGNEKVREQEKEMQKR